MRAAVIGGRGVGRQHLEALRELEGVEVYAVVGTSAASAEAAARHAGASRWSTNYATVLSDPAVDVVHVCVPNHLHAEIAMSALEMGKHVVCEKPLALDVGQAVRMAEVAAASGCVAALCYTYRFLPLVTRLRGLVSSRALGELTLVRGHYLQDWLMEPTDNDWRVDPRQGGVARVLGDIGVHWLDLAETVTGRRVDSIVADLTIVHPRRQPIARAAGDDADRDAWPLVATEDQAILLLRFDGHLPGVFTASQVSAGSTNALEIAIDGTDAAAAWRWDVSGQSLQLGRRGSGWAPVDGQGLAGLVAPTPSEDWDLALRRLLASAYRAMSGMPPVAAGEPSLPTFDDGVRHLRAIEAAFESNRQRAWITVARHDARDLDVPPERSESPVSV